MNGRKRAFPAITAPDTRILILGSLPGERSLAAGRYYAHPQNRFWHLMESVIDAVLAALDYEERIATLLAHKVGLWDTVHSARREGSLDAAMRDIATSDLRALVADLPDLRAIGFNGAAAARIGRKELAGEDVALVPLPSSSPAYAAMPFAEKAERWRALRPFLR